MSRMLELFKGDQDAYQLMDMVRRISHVWDDLIDRDKPMSQAAVHHAFWLSLVGLPSNPFYRQHHAQLLPVLECGILNYIASCALERKPGHERHIAHTARYQVGDVALVIARIVGGLDWAMVVGPELKTLVHDEPFENFNAEMEVRYAQDSSAA